MGDLTFEECEKIGEEEVRKRKANGTYGTSQHTNYQIAESWLDSKKLEREEKYSEEILSTSRKALTISESSNVIAAEANSISRSSNTISERAIRISKIAIVAAIISAVISAVITIIMIMAYMKTPN